MPGSDIVGLGPVIQLLADLPASYQLGFLGLCVIATQT